MAVQCQVLSNGHCYCWGCICKICNHYEWNSLSIFVFPIQKANCCLNIFQFETRITKDRTLVICQKWIQILVNMIEEPNKCIECDFAFLQASDLRRHLKIHSGEKSNKCNQCDFAFSRVSDLRRHWKTHSGEMSFKCNQCYYT